MKKLRKITVTDCLNETSGNVRGALIGKPKAGEEPVFRGCLMIPFSELFLRQPWSNETELVMHKVEIIQITPPTLSQTRAILLAQFEGIELTSTPVNRQSMVMPFTPLPAPRFNLSR